jgi:transposase
LASRREPTPCLATLAPHKKYSFRLPLEDRGFDSSVLAEFRARLLAGGAERRLFETVLACLDDHGFVTARGKQRTDSTHVLAAIHVLNRLECVGETLRHTLNVLATAAPAWLRAWVPGDWFDRYGQRLQESRLPKGKAERDALAEQVGPVPGDQSWQAHQRTSYDVAQFTIDWAAKAATYPCGKTSVIWKPVTDTGGHPVVTIRWAHANCGPCPARSWRASATSGRGR